MSANSEYSELVTTTIRHQHKKGKIVDNFTNHNALLRLMKENGHVKTDADGGTEIVCGISIDENSTYQRYRDAEVLNRGSSDSLTSVKYDWRQASISVFTSGRDLRINRGEARMHNLAKERVKVAVGTAANNFAIDMYSDGALTEQIGGLAHLITVDGTGTVGGINAATYTKWKNQFLDMSAPATFSALKADMGTMFRRCTRGTDKPQLLVASHDLYGVYENGLQDLQRYSDAKMGALGFESLKFNTASIVFDDNTNFGTTAEKMYFLNWEYLYLMQHPDAQWDEEEALKPINQDAVVVPMYWMGNLVCTNRARQGVLFDS